MTRTEAPEETTALVLKDGTGSYFVLPHAALEQWRLPGEHNAELESLLVEQGDVQGYVVPLAVAGGLAFGYGAMIGNAIANFVMDQPKGTLNSLSIGPGGKPR